MNDQALKIQVRLFGGLTERAGNNRIEVTLPEHATVADLRTALAQQHEALAPLLPRVKVAVDLEVAGDDQPVTSTSELALLPPVAGGAGGDIPRRLPRVVTGLSAPPFDVEATVAQITGPEVGATAIFLGTVRDHAPDLEDVVRLDYTAYPDMAVKVLDDIAEAISAEHPEVTGIALLHATGELLVGEHTILIACTSAHRGPAFAACEDALERVKDELPVWKQERTANGDHRWVGLPAPAASQPGHPD